jgi:serine/threonine protein kinase
VIVVFQPPNILIDQSDNIKVADFGLSVQLKDEIEDSVVGMQETDLTGGKYI